MHHGPHRSKNVFPSGSLLFPLRDPLDPECRELARTSNPLNSRRRSRARIYVGKGGNAVRISRIRPFKACARWERCHRGDRLFAGRCIEGNERKPPRKRRNLIEITQCTVRNSRHPESPDVFFLVSHGCEGNKGGKGDRTGSWRLWHG